MFKSSSVFICQSCGWESTKWQGKCPSCGAWNSFLEEVRDRSTSSLGASKAQLDPQKAGKKQALIRLLDLKAKATERTKTGITELDRALGGGLVSGSLVLLAGDPGIGKSTLVSQTADSLGAIYVCAEESVQQVKIRYQRLRLKGDEVLFISDNNLENILTTIASLKKSPRLLIIDSIQTIFTGFIRSSIGSASQIRECTNLLLQFAKKTEISVLIIGHITKEGAIAGPKILEHLVDVVLYLSGDKNYQFRLLQSVKNRFGATDEVGLFEMTDKGMTCVSDPTRLFLHQKQTQPGGSLTIVMQGQRPLLVEVQALVVPTKLAMPRRVVQGISLSKLQVITAVLQKQLGLPLYEYDVFVSVAGGLKVTETAADLAVAAAIFSSLKNKPLPKKSLYFGEVGLLGDVRPVSFGKKRLSEAKSLNFQLIISSETGYHDLRSALQSATA
jgi:DNA repair protein RadA/Sms